MIRGRPKKLTAIELRWINASYKPDVYGVRKITKRVNEGRARANYPLVSRMAIFRAIKSVTKTGNNVTVEGDAP
jgi:hypothetical protein